ncbi:AAA family ATPase [Rhodococcus sp. X156]|uniref:bifunctional aminoglycoside phosphotransferase/ATP-binding protein n=1 Tax=Rhodococcus sp. X156 TaxID=2499145 RepID=UPI000FDAC29F|nr:AAA family ATPase [Rhodococcus sp. X156]
MSSWAAPFAEVRETHSGVVVLVGERAYKAKKPVTTGFLDFSTPQLREEACAREVQLNQRLAPDVYLGVAHLSDPAGGPAEPMVVMRRMPEDRRLSTLVTAGHDVRDQLAELAQLLADFHRKGRRGPQVDAEGTAEALQQRWLANLRETQPWAEELLPPGSLETVGLLATGYLDGRQRLLERRIGEACMVDGHGDLITDDVFCMEDGPRVLDCLDFDERLRFVDVLDDVAFLAMDLEFLGRPDLAGLFLQRCTSAAAAPPPPTSLYHHYLAYRAFVRTKVDCIQHSQGRAGAAADARRHTELALAHLRRGTIRLGVVGGLPGTGKSTVATALAAQVGAVVISSDAVRAELTERGQLSGEAGTFGAGRYRPEATALVYDTMLRRAEACLELGESVVLDASWTDDKHRQAATALASTTTSVLVQLRCVAPPELAAERIRTRRPGFSEATPQTATAMAAVADPWPWAVELDTSADLARTTDAAVAAWTATEHAEHG